KCDWSSDVCSSDLSDSAETGRRSDTPTLYTRHEYPADSVPGGRGCSRTDGLHADQQEWGQSQRDRSYRLGDPGQSKKQNEVPAAIQLCNVRAPDGSVGSMRSVFPERRSLPADGALLDRSFEERRR